MKSFYIQWRIIQVGSILLGASLLFTAPAQSQTVTFALIDLGASDGRPEPNAVGEQVGGAENGAEGVDLDETELTSLTGDDFTIAIDSVNVDGDPVGGIDWRDRGDHPEPEALVQLAEDLLKNDLGVMRVTLAGLPAGRFQITSYHVDAPFDQSANIKVLVTDAQGTAQDTGAMGDASFPDGIPGTDGLTTDIVNATSATFTVVANGTDDVLIYFDASEDAVDDEMPLSGLLIEQFSSVQYALIDLGATGGNPEPGATGEQVGAAEHGAEGIDLEETELESDTGDAFTIAIDNVNVDGDPVGGLDWRDRGDGFDDIPLSFLMEDFIKNDLGVIRVTLGSIPAGNYEVTSYHIDAENSQSAEIKILVTDATGTANDTGELGDASFPDGAPNVDGLTEEIIEEHSTTVSFVADGTNDVVLYFDASEDPVDDEAPLNGLRIVQTGGAEGPLTAFSTSTDVISSGGMATLSWLVEPGATVVIDQGVGDVTDKTNAEGMGSVEVSPNVTTTFEVSVTIDGVTATAMTTVTVRLIDSFAADLESIQAGDSTMLKWQVHPDASVNILPGIGNADELTDEAGAGSVQVSPNETTAYTLTAKLGEVAEEMTAVVRISTLGGPVFALIDIGATGGNPEPGATGGQVGGADNGAEGVDLEETELTSTTGAEFTIAIDSLDVEGEPVGGLDWRDRGDHPEPEPLVQLGEDLVKNDLGIIRVTLGGFPAGLYEITSFHTDPPFDQSDAIKIFVTDAMGEARDTGVEADSSFPDGIPNVDGLTTEVMEQASATFEITANGQDDVIIHFDGSEAADDEVPLSGLIIISLSTVDLQIVAISHDATADEATITWASVTGGTYSVEVSEDLQTWLELDDGVESEGDLTSFTEGGLAENTQRYYRVLNIQ